MGFEPISGREEKPLGFLTNAAFAFAGDMAARAGMFLALLVAARTLPTVEFAELGVAMAVVLIVISVLDLGCSTVVIRDGASCRSARRELLRASFTARMPLALVTVASLAAIGAAVGHLGLALVLAACATANAMQLSLLAVFRSAQTLTIEAITKLVCGVSYPLGVGAVVELGHRTATWTLAAFTVMPLLSLPILLALVRRFADPGGTPVSGRAMLRSAAPFAVMAISTIVYYRSGTVMLGQLSTPRQTADYATASTIAVGLLMLPAAFATSLLPRLAGDRARRERGGATRGALVASIASFVVLAAIVCSTAWWIVPFAYGARYAGAVTPLLILTITGIMIAASTIIGTTLVAAHQNRILVTQVVVALVINLAANAVLIPGLGGVGAAISTALTELASLALLAIAAERVAPGMLLGRRRPPSSITDPGLAT